MLLTRSADIPIVLEVGSKRIGKLEKILSSHNLKFDTIILVTSKQILKKYKKYFKNKFTETFYITNSDIRNVNILKHKLSKLPSNSLVVAFGGGKVMDTVKFSTTGTSLSYLAVPTTLSNDGIYSPVASIVQEDGRRKSVGADIPLGVIIDLEIVQEAPEVTLISGVGDVVSNISALEDWKLAKEDKVEPIDDFAYTLAYMAAETILNLDFKDIRDYKFLKKLAYSLVISGLAMELAKSSRPCSGSEHMFSHSLDYLYPKKSLPHGIQVAFGTLLMEEIRGNDTGNLKEFYGKVGLPTTVSEFGFTKRELIKAIKLAPAIRDRYCILNKIGLNQKALEKIISRF